MMGFLYEMLSLVDESNILLFRSRFYDNIFMRIRKKPRELWLLL